MTSFLGRRLTHAVFTLVGVSLLAFVLIDLAPGRYFEEMRLNPQISPQTLAALQAQYGLDQPLPLRYMHWLQSVSRGELGFSFAYNSPVWPLLRPRLRNTLVLAVTALIFSWLIAIPAGVWAAAHRRRWPDRAFASGTALLMATPDVLIGLALLALALRTRWFPTGGMTSSNFAEMSMPGKVEDWTLHLVLPATALVVVALPILLRHVRSAMVEVLDSPFIQAARAHGIAGYRLLFRHALPAALNPLISLFGVSVGMLLGGSLLIEVIMSWPGVGPLLVQAILERDLYVVVAAVMVSTLLLVAGNLLADVLLYAADPRIRKD
ncbi:MAG TPA: ABC transporter permease [Candidatus Angelobacter sp.]|nr:ABC transporter permease [Candidatus Angelobacter sp.]